MMFKIINYDNIMRNIDMFNISSINIGDNENLKNYLFFINSIQQELDKLNLVTVTSLEKAHDILLVLNEYFHYIRFDSALNKFPKIKYANILICYEIQDDKPIYLGSVLFKIKDDTLYFISMYKSIINNSFYYSEKKFSNIMLDYLLKIAKENQCSFLITFPLDIMKSNLVKYEFEENVHKYGYYRKHIVNTTG